MKLDLPTKICRQCGREYRKKPNVMAAQWGASRFCGRACSGSAVRGKSALRPDEAKLRELYEGQRLTTREIGERYGVAHITVGRWMKFYDIVARPKGIGLVARGIEPPTAERLRELVHVEHKSYETIAEIYGVDCTAVPHWLAKHGIPRPTAWKTRRKGVEPKLPATGELSRRCAAGESAKEIGRSFGLSKTTIRELCIQSGIVPINRRRGKLAGPLGPLYESGLSLEEIGDRIKLTSSRVAMLLAQEGIERRPAGYDNGRRYTCENGQVVMSTYERKVCDWLHAHDLVYEYEPKLPFGGGRGCRADFFVNGWYIEVFGVTGHRTYFARRDRKRAAYKLHGLPLIDIPRKCFYTKTKTWERRLTACLETPLSLISSGRRVLP